MGILGLWQCLGVILGQGRRYSRVPPKHPIHDVGCGTTGQFSGDMNSAEAWNLTRCHGFLLSAMDSY